MNLIYRFIQINLRWYYTIFFKKVITSGIDNIPENSSVIFAVNHQNTVIDALTTGFQLKKELFFLVKSDAFKGKIVKFIFNVLKLIPIYRKSDNNGNPFINNKKTFSLCCEALAKKKQILIFPEGRSTARHLLTPVKKGVARIAIQAIDEDYVKELFIVPVIISYENHFIPNNRLWINYLPPIKVTKNSNYNFNTLTQELESKMQNATITLPADINIINSHFNNKGNNKSEYSNEEIDLKASYFSQLKYKKKTMLLIHILFKPYEFLIKRVLKFVNDEDYHLSIVLGLSLMIFIGQFIIWITLSIIFWSSIGTLLLVMGIIFSTLYLIWVKRFDQIKFN